ncbi:hypothetical protein FRC02_005477 [Tulasnella sp. 418]|nr:hypothetical protein FRC02_005477 [Tulasnella sp. 418]
MIWRLYIVWERNIWVCIPTIITFCGYIAFGIVTVHFSYKGPFYNRPTLTHWWSNVCNMAMTMTTTIWVTSLISFRLWKHRRLMAGTLPARSLKFYHLVLMLMIESGVLYTVSWAAFLIVFCVGSPGQLLLMLQVMPQIVGISPTLILYQLQSGHKSTSVVTESNTLPVPWAPRSTRTKADSCFTVTRPQAIEVDSESLSNDDKNGIALVSFNSSQGVIKNNGSEENV